jgi:sugar O-acyltransferase (sialic acid O-acetyltransferase NeuD family)
MSKVIIFGAASFAEVVRFYLTHDSEHEVVAFTQNASHRAAGTFDGLPLVDFERVHELYPPDSHKMFVAAGYRSMNQIRARLCDEARARGYELITYVSSRATVWTREIGDNCFIFEHNVVQPFTRIGNDVILWSGNHIGHHATIGDHCFISSHVVVSGHVKVGAYCFIGVNASIRDTIEIGEACLIGAGTVIMRSTKPREVYVAERTKPHALSSDKYPF